MLPKRREACLLFVSTLVLSSMGFPRMPSSCSPKAILAAAAFAAAKDGLYCRKDVGANANPVINNQAVGNKTADVLRSAGGFGSTGVK